jgi:hypothetical protein
MALTKVPSPMLRDWAYTASMTDMRMIVDKTTNHTFADLLTFKQNGFNAVMVEPSSVANMSEYFANTQALEMGVVLEYLTDTPVTTYESQPNLIGYYLYDEPANQLSPISIVTQNVRINAWKAVTSLPLMSTFYGQYDLNSAMSPLWDVIFMNWYYRTANTDAENISLALRAYANLRFTCPQTRVIPMVAAFTETGVCTSVSKRINFSRDMVRFSDDGSYAVFAWIQGNTGLFPASPNNNAAFATFVTELPVLVKSKSQLNFETISFTPMIGGAQYFNAALSGTYLEIDQISGGALAFQQSGGLAAFSLPAMGMTDCQFLFRNFADASTTTIRVYQTNDAFVNKTALIVFANTPDNTQLNGLLYNNGPTILGVEFTPAATSVLYGKYIQGFMVYTNWITTSF